MISVCCAEIYGILSRRGLCEVPPLCNAFHSGTQTASLQVSAKSIVDVNLNVFLWIALFAEVVVASIVKVVVLERPLFMERMSTSVLVVKMAKPQVI